MAPDFKVIGGLSFEKIKGFYGGIRSCYLKRCPANEDNSIVAKGYFVSDLNVNYQYKNVNFGIANENIFDMEWNESQFANESRLLNEP